ncbi:DUF3084 domain-containing protein [Leptolyngbya cf. ectocarpi LEGE 11479]|uniref:DUF3084 domain-containing protein n=1 Tax=Leptolyngbya cf. ectocarpi LEGE 11479 TaxID=1828722 RepID=A0A928ZXS9_LEPEC|nr:DUF3084 domain-containing protein [Leptolyngbya ectocarpi]MBE9069467.1 DUF3084 domain-containing protein [Leptolyngbya cf. ectocarpi LEGE 11479]
MDVGLILITTLLVLGGLIATLGDRIGMRVGKARLSLFNLRPRQTATVVSILTGSVISASTLGLMLIASEQLRKGLFEFEETQANLSEARAALENTQTAKTEVERALNRVTRQKIEAEGELTEVNTFLDQATERETIIRERLGQTQTQLGIVSQQAGQLQGEIGRLQTDRQRLQRQQTEVRQQIAQRDRALAARDQELQQRDLSIAQREDALARLQTKQAFLEGETQRLESEFLKLRAGNVAISRNQTLALLITRPQSMAAARAEIEQLLAEANRLALNEIWPDAPNKSVQILRIDPQLIRGIIQNITDGQQYVIRVGVSGNYVVGEPCVVQQQGSPCVEVNLQAKLNRIIFEQGETLARVPIETAYPSTPTLVETLRTLVTSAQIKASLEGIIIVDNPRVAGGFSKPVIDFLNQVQNYGAPLDIEAVASKQIFTTGPLTLELVASRNGQRLFQTQLSVPNPSRNIQ